MMKTIPMVLILLLAFLLPAQGQTLAEWFNQKKTQKKYLMQQIAALEVYKEFLQKGYGVIKDGSKLIGDIKKGEFDLHQDYFGSLKNVNPEIRKRSRADDILKWYRYLVEDKSRIERFVDTKHDILSEKERRQYRIWYNNTMAAADLDMDDLKLLLEDGKLELTDEQRLSRIREIYLAMQQKYGRQRRMTASIHQVVQMKEQAIRDQQLLRKMHGLEQ
jgi:hypothetical protein